MLDGLLGRGFYSKCKPLLKVTNSRIEVIRRKRKATQKFLKKDIAHLLANGLDINAYGRADGLLVELTLSSCYDYIEHSSDFVLKHLSLIQKQSECPEECREAVSSLMFAAARFSDLPELRDLRQMFQEKYGNSIEYFVNKEFVEKLSSKHAGMESKVRLMRDIALEFSVRWDSVAFEQRMSKPSASAQEQNKSYGSFHLPVDNNKSAMGKDASLKGDEHKFAAKERLELPPKYKNNDKKNSVSKMNEIDLHSRRGVIDNGYSSLNGGTKETALKNDGNDILVGGKQEVVEKHGARVHKDDTTPSKVRSSNSSGSRGHEYIANGFELHNGRENPELAPNCTGKSQSECRSTGNEYDGKHNPANSLRNGCDEVDKLRPCYNNAIPPLSVKPKIRDHRFRTNLVSAQAGSGSGGVTKDSSAGEGASISNRSESARSGAYENDHRFQDDPASNPIPKPKSVRRRHSRTQCNNEDAGNAEDTVVPGRSRRRDDSRRGEQILYGDEREEKDEEERVIDRLLMHYSKKPTIEADELRRKSKNRQASNGIRGRPDEESEIPTVPSRSASLPHEPSAPTKVFARLASLHPERSNPARHRHVHPNLPDYNDLAARFASLKGT